MLFAYFGPETMMPVASVIAATVGVMMMFGRNIVALGRGLVRRVWPGARRRRSLPFSPQSGYARVPAARARRRCCGRDSRSINCHQCLFPLIVRCLFQ